MKKNVIRAVVATGIGTALFIVLSYVSIPVGFIPNTAIQPRIALLAFFSAIFGPVVGGAVGILGHALADSFQYGSIWWSWVLPEIVLGVLIGAFASKYKIEEGGFGLKPIILFNAAQVAANTLAWLLLAPVLDILIYAEPSNKVFTQGATAFVLNIIAAGVIGTLLAAAYSRVKSKSSSLSKEI
ncbi:ECF-type riboflavin transporter substrate-binding protein [Gorillibacterium sp. CAU 1737]|uniref:ECF-type riboflavin transporter substrate-binding protein n=1 Tax=Gorillibacterium sp. CAU 1737 TaxID=3140362 RepID=UPI0032615FEA